MPSADSISRLQAVLKAYGLKPRKSFGQNFLIDRNILVRIGEKADLRPDEYVVEIGPGLGALTQHILPRCKGVLAIDVDHALREPLLEIMAGFQHFRLLNQDVLTVDLEPELQKTFSLPQLESFAVCANIPYRITSPIIFQLLERCPHLRTATLMIQKEVAERILAKPGTKAYGVLTVMVAWYAEVQRLLAVSKNCFYPRPEVDSVVLQFNPRKQKIPCKDEQVFKHLVRSAFQMRRKTMLNICCMVFNLHKEEVKRLLLTLDITPEQRPETLSLTDFIRVADRLGTP